MKLQLDVYKMTGDFYALHGQGVEVRDYSLQNSPLLEPIGRVELDLLPPIPKPPKSPEVIATEEMRKKHGPIAGPVIEEYLKRVAEIQDERYFQTQREGKPNE